MNNMKRKKTFEVYVCKYDGEILYVGSGKTNRHKHCISGVSHVFKLNQLYFSGKVVTVEVVERFYTREEAFEYEFKLIEELSPTCNVMKSKDISSHDSVYVEARSKWLDFKWLENIPKFFNYRKRIKIFIINLFKHYDGKALFTNGVPKNIVITITENDTKGMFVKTRNISNDEIRKFILFITENNIVKLPIDPLEIFK